METNIDKFEIFRELTPGSKERGKRTREKVVQYRYRAVGKNGEILFGGEAHPDKSKVQRALDGSFGALIDENSIPVNDLTERVLSKYRVEGIPEDEPVFVIRAQDKVAVAAIQSYIGEAQDAYDADANEYPFEDGDDHPFIQSVQEVEEEFKVFAAEHPDRMKYPD